MTLLSNDDLKSHPLFTNVVLSFPQCSDWLNEAKNDDLVSGVEPSTLWSSGDSGFDVYFVKNLLKKVENLDLGVDPNVVAFDDFRSFLIEQEKSHSEVSARLSVLNKEHDLFHVLAWVRKFFARVFSSFNPNDIIPRDTSGATLTLKRGSSIFDRYKAAEGAKALQQKGFWSRSDLDHASAFEHEHGGVEYRSPILTGLIFTLYKEENATSDFFVRLLSVTKNAKIGRIIGIQPSTVLAQQNGFGDFLTEGLVTYCGIDISTASELHKTLAMEASLTDLLCTLDQKNASNNILRILCEYVLPKHAFEYMVSITPSLLDIEGEMVTTHMMCPAGNGYIFPFQTMLYWALIRGTQHVMRKHSKVWVFGDDVIMDGDIFDNVTLVLEAVGLQVNKEKSFKDGPFRESCGGDYVYGSNVRPLYVKRIPTSTIDWIRVINGIRRIGYYNNANVWRSDSFRSLWLRCIRTVPVKERLYCPRHYGDSGINTEFSCFYKLAKPADRDAEGRRYPDLGYQGEHAYNSERIKLYVAYTAGEKKSFSEVTKGIRADALLRLLAHPSVRGSGGRLIIDNEKSVFKYPRVFNGTFEGYRRQNVPFTLFGSAPSETEDLFAFLQKVRPELSILDSDAVVDNYHVKLQTQRLFLIRCLYALSLKKEQTINRVKEELRTLKLS